MTACRLQILSTIISLSIYGLILLLAERELMGGPEIPRQFCFSKERYRCDDTERKEILQNKSAALREDRIQTTCGYGRQGLGEGLPALETETSAELVCRGGGRVHWET